MSDSSIMPKTYEETYSYNVFIARLKPNTTGDELREHFERFGRLVVDWPQKQNNAPPRGYAFLLFFEQISIHRLIDACVNISGEFFYHGLHNRTHVRPWRLTDCDFVRHPSYPSLTAEKRMTIFVNGLPRNMTANELTDCMSRNFGVVLYAGINIDTRYLSPIGTARVNFLSYRSYYKALSQKQLQIQHGWTMKTLSMRPYVLSDQVCDECHGVHSTEKFASWFCGHLMCLKYYCTHCWELKHSEPAYRGEIHFRMPTVIVPYGRSP